MSPCFLCVSWVRGRADSRSSIIWWSSELALSHHNRHRHHKTSRGETVLRFLQTIDWWILFYRLLEIRRLYFWLCIYLLCTSTDYSISFGSIFFKVHYYCGPIVTKSGYYERIPWLSKTYSTQICFIQLCMFTMKV